MRAMASRSDLSGLSSCGLAWPRLSLPRDSFAYIASTGDNEEKEDAEDVEEEAADDAGEDAMPLGEKE